MALTKRGKYWHFDFIYRGRRYQGSTDQANVNKAKLVEAKVRSDVALEKFGIGPTKLSPLFKDFMEGRFLDDARRNAKARRTAIFYSEKTRRLLSFSGWLQLRLTEIDEGWIGKYADFRLQTVSPTAINGELATLRKALNLAYEWQLIARRPRIRRLPGEQPREFVVSGELEREYLEMTDYPLRHAAVLILDLGLRPEECVALLKRDISSEAVTVIRGKSKNARRAIPLTSRAQQTIELISALWPDSPWLFPGRKGKHYTRGALDNAHTKVRKAKGWPEEFVPYSFRHTFGTRLAESGASEHHITKLMGHYSIVMSQRYIHPQSEGLELAMKRKEALDKIRRGDTTHESDPTKLSNPSEVMELD